MTRTKDEALALANTEISTIILSRIPKQGSGERRLYYFYHKTRLGALSWSIPSPRDKAERARGLILAHRVEQLMNGDDPR